MSQITSLGDDARIALDNLGDAASHLLSPTVRFGVTGLSRAGKTVFISALVHNLLNSGRLPLFSVASQGRLRDAALEPQPDDTIPRFKVEQHLDALLRDRTWPSSTSSISQLRVRLKYDSAGFFARNFGAGELTLDIVDYPGEWLLDLPLLGKTFETWSREALALSRLEGRADLASTWHAALAEHPFDGPASEVVAEQLSAHFTEYLRACRSDDRALSTLPPGRFLMPGDMEGSPALTFCPLDCPHNTGQVGADTLHGLMARRFESYKSLVIKPFFRDHFARIDRQIVLVDVLSAINAGSKAVADLETALGEILDCFNHGRRSWLTSLFSTRTDRILFAATKADHLHHTNHDRLESILNHLVRRARERAQFSGAHTDVVALAALRATTEGEIKDGKDTVPIVVGTPLAGETLGDETFDGLKRTGIFPGDLPHNPKDITDPNTAIDPLRFVRFRPPEFSHAQDKADTVELKLPHIRLDRALEFLFGDYLQ
ncbi:MAG: YcjX family protein [Pseudomonadota bacterium]